MAFWSDGVLEPKRQFRFKVTFPDIDNASTLNTGASTFLAQYADRPTYTVTGETAVHFLDKEFKFPGKVKWTPIKVRFVDVAEGKLNVARLSYDFLIKEGWLNPGSMNPANFGNSNNTDLRTVNKRSAVKSATGITIDVLDSNGSSVEKWVLKNPFVTTVGLNALDYSQDGVLTAEYNFTYDWAEFSLP